MDGVSTMGVYFFGGLLFFFPLFFFFFPFWYMFDDGLLAWLYVTLCRSGTNCNILRSGYATVDLASAGRQTCENTFFLLCSFSLLLYIHGICLAGLVNTFFYFL